MKQLETMKDQLISVVQGQLTHIDSVDTKELGEAIDMIKDLAEAVYYCSITEAMEEGGKEKSQGGNTYYYTMPPMYYESKTQQEIPYTDYSMGRMYYSGGNSGNSSSNGGGNNNSGGSNSGGSNYYTPRIMPEYREREMMMPDPREGRAKQSRRMYMESKDMHKDSGTQMKELEKYIQDLGEDITEMIQKASPEEKQLLQQKIATLSAKIK